jgi:thiamine pyrophosphokinase
MSRFAILLGGALTPTARLQQQLVGARVIAADSGITHAAALNLKPELWLGDFDSASSDLDKAFSKIPRDVHPKEKDATDGDLAISEALRRGATEIVLVGGFGGQFDHVLTHTAMLLALARREIPCMITSGSEEAHPLTFELLLSDLKPGTRISIVPMSDVRGLTIQGVKWPLNHKNVPFGSTLTMSNEVTGPVTIQCDIGSGLVVVYP